MTGGASRTDGDGAAPRGPRLTEHADPVRLLEAGLRARPHRDAVVAADGRWSYAELDAAVDGLAGTLAAHGLAAGGRLATLLGNGGTPVLAYLAAARIGAVAAPVNFRAGPAEIEHVLSVFAPDLVFADPERCDGLGGILGRTGTAIVRAEDAQAASPPPAPPTDPDRPCLVLFTSGSTGPSRGACHTVATIGAMAGSLRQGLELGAADGFLAGSSLSHQAGIAVALATLSAGGRIVVPASGDPGAILAALRAERPTVAFLLPAAIARLVAHPDARRDDFASVRYFGVGGDRIPVALHDAVRERTGLALREGYGMSEIGGSNMTPPDGPARPGSIGPLMPGFVARLVDADGRDVPPGVDGRLLVRAPSVATGYWGAPEATAAAFRDGWFDTGDVMARDGDGWFRFRARAKEIIVRDGLNIAPAEPEDALLAHPSVAGAGAVALPDGFHGERVRGYVALRPGATATPDELVAFARRLAGLKAPQEVAILPALPLTAAGKVDRAALRRLALASGAPEKEGPHRGMFP